MTQTGIGKGWPAWKQDVGTIGGGLAVGGILAGSIVGLRYLNQHIDKTTPHCPADYVTMMGAEYNRHFHTLKQFCKTHEEKSFLKTLRHRLSRLVKLFHNQGDRHKDTMYWSRLGEVEIRLQEVYTLITNLQFRIKERYGDEPTVGFDDAILEIRNMAEDIEHDNSSLRTDVQTMSSVDASNTGMDPKVQPNADPMMYQILTGIFAGLSLILIVVTVWMMIARRTGRSAPIPQIQGGFSLGSLGAMMSTS